MKFTANRDALIEALVLANKATSAKQMAILGNVHISPRKGAIEILGHNLSTAVFTSVPAAIEEPSNACVPGATVAAFLEKCAEPTVTVTLENKKANIKCGRAKTTLACAEPEDYPQIERLGSDALSCEICTDEFFYAIKSVMYACAEQCAKVSLQCLNIKISGNKLHITACDGYRAATVEKSVSATGKGTFNIFKNDIKTAMAVLSGEKIELRYNSKTLEFIGADSVCKVNLCAEEYPDIEKQIQKAFSGATEHITVKAAAIKSTLARICALPSQSVGYPLRLDISDNITLSYNFGTGTFTDEVECKLDGEPFTVGVGTQFFADALKSVRESITIGCHGEKGAITVDSGDMRQMLMPMRLKK